MRLVSSNQLSDLAEIYSDDVELVSIARPNFERIESLSQQLILSRQAHQVQWVQTSDEPDIAQEQLPDSMEASVRSMLADQVNEGCDVLATLLGCATVGVRLATLRSPMCPSFHVDKIPCRLLITLSGNGTEWIPNSDVDWPVSPTLRTRAFPSDQARQSSNYQLAIGHCLRVEPGTALIMVLSIDRHKETANDSFCHWIQFFIKASRVRRRPALLACRYWSQNFGQAFALSQHGLTCAGKLRPKFALTNA